MTLPLDDLQLISKSKIYATVAGVMILLAVVRKDNLVGVIKEVCNLLSVDGRRWSTILFDISKCQGHVSLKAKKMAISRYMSRI